MKLQSLTLHNFRNIDQKIEFGDRLATVIVGPNGAGKSTIGGSLEFLFSGKHPWQQGRGDKLEDLVQVGKDYCSVSARPAGQDAAITRRVPHALSLTGLGSNATLSEAQARLDQAMGCTADTARLSLRAGQFFHLKPKEQLDLWYELLAAGLSTADVERALEQREEQTGLPLLEAARALCKPLSNDLGSHGSKCYETRTVVNKQLRDAKSALERERKRAANLVFAKAPDQAELQNARVALRDVQDALAALQARHNELARARADVGEARATVSHLEAQIGPDAAQSAGNPIVIERQVRDGEKLLAALHDKLKALRAQADAQNRASQLRSRRDQLTQATACPTCGHEVAPDNATVLARIADLDRQLDELGQATDEDLTPAIAALEDRARKGEHYLAERREALRRANTAARAQGQLGASLENLRAREERLAELEQDPLTDPAELAQRHIETSDAVLKLERQAENAREWTEHQSAVNKLESEVAKLSKRAEILTELVCFFGPEGLRKQLLARRAAELVAQLNEVLGCWGLEAIYELPEFELRVRPHQGQAWVPYHRLSDSEQILVALAHALFFAQVTGLRIVVIDRLEALDAVHQAALFAGLDSANLAERIDHVICLGVELRVEPGDHVQVIKLGEVLAHV